RQRGVERPAGTELYVSLDQHGVSPPSMNVVMRTTLPPAALSGTIERVVRELDAAVPVVRLRDMDSVFAESIRRPRLLAQLLGAFAGLALLLAAIGTYGALSYMVTERRREIGIRVALGATRSHVLTQIMKQGLQVTAIGGAIGLAGALAVNRLIASLLFGVQPTDIMTIAFVIATITAVAVVASWLPAWRASRLDPNVVLRDEEQLRKLSYAILLFPGWIVATRKPRPMKPRFRKVALKTGPITRDQDPWQLSVNLRRASLTQQTLGLEAQERG